MYRISALSRKSLARVVQTSRLGVGFCLLRDDASSYKVKQDACSSLFYVDKLAMLSV